MWIIQKEQTYFSSSSISSIDGKELLNSSGMNYIHNYAMASTRTRHKAGGELRLFALDSCTVTKFIDTLCQERPATESGIAYDVLIFLV